MEDLALKYILSTILYSMLGLILFIFSLIVIEKITKFSITKKVVEEGNIAVSIVIGSIMIAMGIIISSAIH
jgi:uncharacterized membrane protein YjfL (UPF0719 family)